MPRANVERPKPSSFPMTFGRLKRMRWCFTVKPLVSSHVKSRKDQTFRLLRSMLKKAAPRFELGIKDLQSSALPLGHAAVQGASTPQTDRISEGSGSLLIISDGHGEDLIALRIIEALRNQRPQLTLKVLPLVGTGGSFRTATEQGWVQQIGPSAPLPSGGFSNQSLRGLLADVIAGLPLLT